jgi:DNA-binding MarR family transcriptional regulator
VQPGDVGDAVVAASRVLVAVALRSQAVHDGVTLSQFRAVVALQTCGPRTMGGLAEQLECSRSAATRLCDRLVRKGLVARTPGRSRREVVVKVTAAGAALVNAVVRHRRLELGRIVAKMAPEARIGMLEGLDAFTVAAGDLPEGAWRLGWVG